MEPDTTWIHQRSLEPTQPVKLPTADNVRRPLLACPYLVRLPHGSNSGPGTQFPRTALSTRHCYRLVHGTSKPLLPGGPWIGLTTCRLARQMSRGSDMESGPNWSIPGLVGTRSTDPHSSTGTQPDFMGRGGAGGPDATGVAGLGLDQRPGTALRRANLAAVWCCTASGLAGEGRHEIVLPVHSCPGSYHLRPSSSQSSPAGHNPRPLSWHPEDCQPTPRSPVDSSSPRVSHCITSVYYIVILGTRRPASKVSDSLEQ